MKHYLWGFPGVGKSHLDVAGLRIVDADCQLFQFQNLTEEDLHSPSGDKFCPPNNEYPDNYFRYVQSVNADIVLLNCHLSFLEEFNKDDVLIVYPNINLMDEYLSRYAKRGDATSFCNYMAHEWAGMVEYIETSRFDRYEITSNNVYLSDLFERNDFKMKLMSRKELIEQLQRAKDLDVIALSADSKTLECSLEFLNDASVYGIAAEDLAEAVLDGKYELDIEQLLMVCLKREAEIEKEKVFLDRRGGLSREELEDKIMQGIVNGALNIRHGQIAPYSYGYNVKFLFEDASASGSHSWNCYCDLFEVPKTIVQKIEQDFDFNVKAFLSAVEQAEKTKITSFTPEKESSLVRAKNSYTYPYRNSIAGIGDVHKGNGLDGIAKGYFGGDYSSMTTSSQNDLVQTLVFLKGFCLDCLDSLYSRPEKENVINYLKKHGTDISTPEKLQGWIQKNPDKCAIEENRRVSLENQIADARNKPSDFCSNINNSRKDIREDR